MSLVDYLESIKTAIPGLQSISITDRDGVEVFSTSRAELNADALQTLSVIFALTHEQCQKLEEFGETSYLLTEYLDGSSFLQANLAPLLLSMKARGVARNILVDAADKCRGVLKDLRKQIASTVEY